MRKGFVVLLSAVLFASLVVPNSAWARRIVSSGSVTITLAPPGTLTSQLVVTVVETNVDVAGGENAQVSTTLPLFGGLYTFPFFVNKETTANVPRDFDTVMFIVNNTDVSQFPFLTVRNASGTVVATIEIVGGVAPRGTRNVRLSDILP